MEGRRWSETKPKVPSLSAKVAHSMQLHYVTNLDSQSPVVILSRSHNFHLRMDCARQVSECSTAEKHQTRQTSSLQREAESSGHQSDPKDAMALRMCHNGFYTAPAHDSRTWYQSRPTCHPQRTRPAVGGCVHLHTQIEMSPSFE